MPSNRSASANHPDSDLQHLALPGQSRVLLASDMHLGEHDPETANFFSQALRRLDDSYSHLILLGDLFEAWAGDDQTDPVALGFIDQLAAIAANRPVYVMRGNRDFLLDLPLPGAPATPAFSQLSGATMLADECVLSVGDRHWLLAHGDSFCTDDLAYQTFRRESRQMDWINQFLAQPLARRSAIAREMREQSKAAKSNKPENLTDVNQQAIQASLDSHQQREMIHGHTHRPAHHDWQVGGVSYARHVLPDWDARDERGGFLLLDVDGLQDQPAQAVPVSQPCDSDLTH